MGWGDCVDRIPGHPASIDAIVALTPDVIATGSEDGMIRVTQLLPTKFCKSRRAARFLPLEHADNPVGVIASHEEYPIERLKLDRNKRWLGSVSHDECVKLTDVEDIFEESDGEEDEDMEGGGGDGDSDEEVEESKPSKKEPSFFDDL